MRGWLIFFLALPVFAAAQKNKKLDVVSNVEAKVLMLKPLGNNSLSKDLEPFYGFAFGGNLMTPLNFGIGADYSMLFSNVKFDRQAIYGNIGSPRLTIIDVFLTHRHALGEDLYLEEMTGFSFFRQTGFYLDNKNKKLKYDATGFNLGLKLLYTLDPNAYQAVFVAGKFHYYSGDVYNEEPDTSRYFSQSAFLSLNLGYRFNF